jgi:hypothetical protein
MVDPRRPACIRAGTEPRLARSGDRTDAAAATRSYRRGDIDGRRIPMSRRRSIRGSRLAAAAVAAVALGVGAAAPAGAAPHSVLCVGGKPACFTTIQAAVDAAGDGDTVTVAPGTYAGGITIDKSLELDGAGAGATVIAGGGPVVTIGTFEGDNGFTVSIDGVTITGGLNDSVPSRAVVGGGGVAVMQSKGQTTGATVTISNSVVTGNRVDAGETIPSGGFSCRNTPHDCAFVSGGGIANAGALTLDHVEVTRNAAGSTPTSPSLASSAGGGGISSNFEGTLILRHCSVTGNAAAVNPPNGSFTDGGGIADGGPMTIEESSVDDNSSVVVASVPSTFAFDDQEEANAGGIQLSPGATATISHTTVDGNTVSSVNSGGDAHASSGGIHNHGALALDHASVSGNTASAVVPAGAAFLAGAIGGGLQLGTDPSTTTVAHSRVDGNTARADSPTGAVTVLGAGIANLDGTLALDHADVSGNDGTANGAHAWFVFGASLSALGGGVLNTTFGGSGPILAVDHGAIAGNTVATSTGAAPHGGGLLTRDLISNDPFAVTLDHTTVAGNSPDDCDGC